VRWLDLWDESIAIYYSVHLEDGEPVKDRWIVRRRRLVPPVPYWPPIWHAPTEAVPWRVPRFVLNVAQPWWWARVYCHVAERALFDLWWWSRGPMWFVQDLATSIDWRIQGAVKARVEERHERTVRIRR
jgi:hypothetical protein